jgi:hypothetical protein
MKAVLLLLRPEQWIKSFLSSYLSFLKKNCCVLNKEFKYRNVVIFSTAAIFSLLGCYTIYRGLSIMGQPLLMFGAGFGESV